MAVAWLLIALACLSAICCHFFAIPTRASADEPTQPDSESLRPTIDARCELDSVVACSATDLPARFSASTSTLNTSPTASPPEQMNYPDFKPMPPSAVVT